ncbi:hypothetical protein SAMN05660690_2332 [Geodermatophilus telluris]|uniref:EcsC protein family protein n=1 Tax=Geodermatophilus telluris TaxID=1190417 RepID=A0A1G6P1L2_9ACTN|nr:hypothetical protein [Geodermatophilus telluris]SDC73386.1 hypothetical protein SAMN05660690_2332 [Geodermatophilus telluris]
MSEHGDRRAAPRDVPPPRPVQPAVTAGDAAAGGPAWLAEDSGLGRAARAVADAVAGLLGSAPDDAAPDGERRSAAGTLRDVLGAVASAATRRGDAPAAADDESRSPGTVLGDLLAAAAPRLPIRDAARLRAAHPGRSDEEIADALVTRASRVTAAVGAATGGLSAAHWFAPPSLVALPLELGAETLLVAAVEVVLLGELHELAGRPAPGDPRDRALAYLSSWTQQRSVEGTTQQGVGAVLGTAGFRALRRRLSRRMLRNVGSAAPLLVGAALGGRGNLKATETLARRVRADLRRAGS